VNTSSIRTHLMLLVVAVSAPLVMVGGFDIYDDMNESVESTKTSLRTMTQMMVSNTGGRITNARQILERLAARPLVKRLDPGHCDGILKDLRDLNLSYADVGYTNMKGELLCSTLLHLKGKRPDLSKLQWFQTFKQNQRFTIGQPFFGPISGKWVSVFSEPIWNERHEMIGGVQFSVDLSVFDPNIPAQFLPDDSYFGFISEDGTLIWRNHDPNKVVGTRSLSDAARRVVEVRNGEFESRSADGVMRFFSVVQMPETGWMAFVGVPVSAVYAGARQRAITVAAVVLAVLAGMFALAIAIARRIAAPVAELEKAANAVRHGDFSVRAALGGPKDIALVAREFNAMIEDRLQSDAQLRIAATAFESQEGMMITDANYVILRANHAITEITGYGAEELIGRTPRMLRSGRHSEEFYAQMWDTVKRTGKWQGEVLSRRKNGEIYPKWLTITAVKGRDGSVTHFVTAETDITARKAAEDEIAMLAFYDPLTELPNRRLLLDRLQLAQASSTRSARHGALLFIDLDNFKTLNDTLGHDMGDLLLQQVAQRLSSCIREDDTVARLGGDEFVVMLQGLSENAAEAATQAQTLGEKILAMFKQPFALDGHEILSSPSIGITLFIGHQTSIKDLLKQADLAMYQSKAAGRNTLRFFDPLT
jgi:diguanylate cyclase (GGDEF)-like protein/PAS domain S-box-containing protein